MIEFLLTAVCLLLGLHELHQIAFTVAWESNQATMRAIVDEILHETKASAPQRS